MSPAADSVIRRLDAARQKWWLFTLLSSAIIAASASLVALLAFMLTDALLRLPQPMLLAMFLAWLACTAALTVFVGRRMLRGQRSLEATARRVESEFPEIGSDLINLVQLAEDRRNENRAFCDAAVRVAAAKIGHIQFDGAADRLSRWRRFRNCMQTPRDLIESFGAFAALVALAIACQLLVPNWGSAATRLLSPWEFVPTIGSAGEITVTPGDAQVLVGNSLEIVGELENPEAAPRKGMLFLEFEGSPEEPRVMQADQKQQRFALSVPAITRPFRYRLEIGDSQSKVYRVNVQPKPTITEMHVTLRYPPYLGRTPETFTQRHADLEAPQFSEVDLKIRSSVPLERGHLMIGATQRTGRVDPTGELLTVEKIPLLDDTTYTIHLTTHGGLTDPDPRVNRIRVIKDRAPTVELLKPPRQCTSAPGESLPAIVRAADDYGLSTLRLELKVQQAADSIDEGAEGGGGADDASNAGAAPENLPAERIALPNAAGAASATRQTMLLLDPAKYSAGQIVWVRAVALDTRRVEAFGRSEQPQQAASGWHAVRLVPAEDKSAAGLEQLDSLRGDLFKLLERQIRARVKTATIVRAEPLTEQLRVVDEVRVEQVAIQQTTGDLAASIADTDQEAKVAIKRVLSKLAFDEMLNAVELADALGKLPSTEAFPEPTNLLLETQDQIIDVLRRVLDATRQAEADALEEMKKRQGGDLPDDTQKKLEEAKAKLEEFLKQQKKVIEASENLAKVPVDDFTEKEEQLLKELAASQDDWAKFMKELHTDLSKLPEQDFSNPALLKELVEIQTELKMAEDALLKKTADIAVPLEQLGAEMAEEIKTNLEKWLPDDPDRERWSQEESLTDENKEAPMAELPGELEDLIGELMEEEEDIFDEMEDVSSSAADSLDKGAGWEVADGPISNMSAKGATGNRLPNTSEIGGRAGEGRSGKSSGEFVGEEAVGKGGRKTPSRLTPDPYMKGQIEDHSKDDQGGATGGGKESGQGGKGLEGPAPNAPGPRDLQRLAGKQAALRNKAEGVELQFQVMNFHRTDLSKLIESMAQIERDLRAGRYQSALRERKVLLDGMGNVKQYLEGEFAVKQDATANLPTDIQKEILGSMQDVSPAGWEEFNRRYFERLSQGETQ